jgi:hypothetical protein
VPAAFGAMLLSRGRLFLSEANEAPCCFQCSRQKTVSHIAESRGRSGALLWCEGFKLSHTRFNPAHILLDAFQFWLMPRWRTASCFGSTRCACVIVQCIGVAQFAHEAKLSECVDDYRPVGVASNQHL